MTPPLVFLHGWGLHGGVWQGMNEAFPGRECLCPDLPGYGASPMAAPYDAPTLAAAVADTAPAASVPVGWSMGGMVALAWAALRPDRVRALVLVATNPAFMNRAGWERGLAPEVLAGFAESLRADYRATLLRFLSLQARGGDAAREVIARLREQVFARGEPDAAVLAAGLELLRTVDLRGLAAEVRCPTLIVHGAYDNLCPASAADWLAETLPDARLALHPRAAHAPFLSHPEWFATTVNGFVHDLG